MSTGAVGVLRRKERYIHGSAAPAIYPRSEPFSDTKEIPLPRERAIPEAAPKAVSRTREREERTPGVSLFAIAGSLAVTVLMIFVMLAQVNLNEVARETARLNAHRDALTEQQKVLTIAFESVVDMKEVERYAKDVLGMSRPEAEQYTVLRTTPSDRAEVYKPDGEDNGLQGFGSYLSYLFSEYIFGE